MNTANKNFLKNPTLPVVTTFISLTILSMLLLYIGNENFFLNILQFDVLHSMMLFNIIFSIHLVGRYIKNKKQQA